MGSFLLIGWSQCVRAEEKEKLHQKEQKKTYVIPIAEHNAPKPLGGCSPWDPRCKKN